MTFLTVNFENQETILQSFDRIADKISKDIQIKINDNRYRIVDFEFYTYSEAFQDPHTHKHNLQLEAGKFYLHSSGVDITCGDGVNYGGILLRGIIKLDNEAGPGADFMIKQFDGPQLVATELFSNLFPLDSGEKNEISLVDIDGHYMDALFRPAKLVLKTQRVGLSPTPYDTEAFFQSLPIRYITVLHKSTFKQTIKGIEGLLNKEVVAGKITEDEANGILGYKKTFA
jgi:hypothetical protein